MSDGLTIHNEKFSLPTYVVDRCQECKGIGTVTVVRPGAHHVSKCPRCRGVGYVKVLFSDIPTIDSTN